MSLGLVLVLLAKLYPLAAGYNDFPSLITANASMALLVEKAFFENARDYEKTMSSIRRLVSEAAKESMEIGGIEVTLFDESNVNFGHDYSVLLSVASCQSTWRLFKEAEKEKLVHVALTDPDCPRIPEEGGIGLPLLAVGEELAQILLDLRMSGGLAWPRLNFIHDDSLARETTSRVVKALSAELPAGRLRLTARTLFSAAYERNEALMRQRARRLLGKLRDLELGSCFMLVVTLDLIPSILQVAKSLGMLGASSQWLFVVNESSGLWTNFTSLLDLVGEGENVSFIRNVTHGSECQMGLTCHVQQLVRALAKSLEGSLRRERELYERINDEEFEIVRLSKAERKLEIIKSMKKELASGHGEGGSICGGCLDWRLVAAITWGSSFESLEEQQPAHLEETGSWSPGFGIRMSQPLFPHFSHGFRGVSLPVVTFHNPPWQIVERSASGALEYGGLVFDVLRHLSVKLNFSYTVRLVSSLGPAARLSPNSSSGWGKERERTAAAMSVAQGLPQQATELVRSQKALLAAVALSIGQSLHELNFTASIAVQTYALLAARPESLSRALLFCAPFAPEVWIYLSATLLMIGPILYLTLRLSPHAHGAEESRGLSSLWQCSWYVYGALLQQGGMSLPKADSARLVVGSWWLVIMVLVASYSGNLIAFLTFPRLDSPIDSLEDLLERESELTWSFPNGSALESYLAAAASKDDKYKRLLAGASRQDPTKPLDVLERIKHQQLVLIDSKVSLAFLMSNDLNATGTCNFHISANDFMHEDLAMVVAANSPYLALINREIKRMNEAGLISKWTAEKMPMKDMCWESSFGNQEATNHKVNMGDMQGIFFVLAIGFTMAGLTIGSEYLWHRRKERAARNLVRPFVS